MHKSIKAALLSGLVFPGLGHFYLKRYAVGAIISGLAIACTYYIVSKAMQQVYDIVDQIESGAVQPDMVTITEMVSKQLSGAEGDMLNLTVWLLVAVWVVGVIAAYLAGKSNQDEAG